MTPLVKVVKISGILNNRKSSELRQEINDILKNKVDIILLDLKEVTFIDSTGLGTLVAIFKSVNAAGAKLFICSINSQIQMLFELTRMDRVFKVFTSQEEFYDTLILAK